MQRTVLFVGVIGLAVAAMFTMAMAQEAKAPATAPATGATTAPAAAAATEKSPWADANVGTMVKYKMMGDVTQTIEVIKADSNSVTLRGTSSIAGAESREQTMPRMVTADEMKAQITLMGKKGNDDTIKIAGKDLKCQTYTLEQPAGDKTMTAKRYVCKDIPGWLVRVDGEAAGSMKTLMEVVEYKN